MMSEIKKNGLQLKKLLIKKRFTKQDKEKKILLGLVEKYIETNTPVGSNSLKESGYEDMSSATIRNYFATLEQKGLLMQPYISGGRIPTMKAFKIYAHSCLRDLKIDKKDDQTLKSKLLIDTKEIAHYLNSSLEVLSELCNLSVFQSSPRFDQDFISNVKLMSLDSNRLLCVIITDFGLIKTEILHIDQSLNEKDISLIEGFFLWRMNKSQKPIIENQKLYKLAQHLYNEIMVRYIVGYTTLNIEDIEKTALSKLLSYPEFKDPSVLAEALSIFEDQNQMHKILKDCIKNDEISVYIGKDLEEFGLEAENTSLICIPYYVGGVSLGAIGVLCPIRSNYKKIFAILEKYSQYLSTTLSKNIYKYKITYRKTSDFKKIDQSSILLEDKSKI
jgi:heat-inducible transcriptional repressor